MAIVWHSRPEHKVRGLVTAVSCTCTILPKTQSYLTGIQPCRCIFKYHIFVTFAYICNVKMAMGRAVMIKRLRHILAYEFPDGGLKKLKPVAADFFDLIVRQKEKYIIWKHNDKHLYVTTFSHKHYLCPVHTAYTHYTNRK